MKKYYLKHIKYHTDILYGKGLLEEPIYLSRWVWNWKFPFLHRVTKKYTVIGLQKLMNKHLDSHIKRVLKSGFTKTYTK